MVADGNQRVGQVHRLAQRHVHLPEDLQGAGPFHGGGLVQFLRDALEGLAQQKDAEGRRHVRQADGQRGIQHPDGRHGAVVLHHQHVGHYHELHEHQREQDALAGEVVLGEGVGRQRAQHQLPGQHHGHQQHGVDQVAGEGGRVPRHAEIIQRQRRGKAEPGGKFRRVKGRPHGVQQRQRPQQGQGPRGGGVQHAGQAPAVVDVGLAHL